MQSKSITCAFWPETIVLQILWTLPPLKSKTSLSLESHRKEKGKTQFDFVCHRYFNNLIRKIRVKSIHLKQKISKNNNILKKMVNRCRLNFIIQFMDFFYKKWIIFNLKNIYLLVFSYFILWVRSIWNLLIECIKTPSLCFTKPCPMALVSKTPKIIAIDHAITAINKAKNKRFIPICTWIYIRYSNLKKKKRNIYIYIYIFSDWGYIFIFKKWG